LALLSPIVLERLDFAARLLAIDQLTALGLQEAYLDMGNRG